MPSTSTCAAACSAAGLFRAGARRVLTLEWIDGIPISDREGLAAAGHEVKPLGARLMQTGSKGLVEEGAGLGLLLRRQWREAEFTRSRGLC